jgi:hypothetical protein
MIHDPTQKSSGAENQMLHRPRSRAGRSLDHEACSAPHRPCLQHSAEQQRNKVANLILSVKAVLLLLENPKINQILPILAETSLVDYTTCR